MFIFSEQRKVTWPVTIQVPADGGTVSDVSFDVVYRLLPESEFNALANQGDVPLLDDVVLDWTGVTNEKGEPLPFSSELLGKLLDIPYVRRALASGYLQANLGAPAKNSQRLPGVGENPAKAQPISPT